ncbi:thermonuclease family protein [Sphingorhabdus arenilitoris]
MIIALMFMLGGAYIYSVYNDNREIFIPSPGAAIRAADGDSFSVGAKKLRLRGIDAPERDQICVDENGKDWPCGLAAKAALARLLEQPNLTCEAGAYDRFGRALAKCAVSEHSDIAANLVASGFAVSQEFNGIRDYSREEDRARSAKRGIWRGTFTPPREWRDTHPR